MHLRLLRHATLMVTFAGRTVLVDPMLADAASFPAVPNTANTNANPLVPLPLDAPALDALLTTTDAVLVTHLHRDHWDAVAASRLPKALPLLCQPEDADRLRAEGFTHVLPIVDRYEWDGITITRTPAQHGTGVIAAAMAPVSGFLVAARGEPLLYVAGDTIWYPEMATTLAQYRPDVVVVNAGEARFNTGDPITMSAADVVAVMRALPTAQVVAVHLEAINHCGLSRHALRDVLRGEGLTGRAFVPDDGEHLTFAVPEVTLPR